MAKPVISADSHVTEPPGTYVDRIDPKYRDVAPRLVRHEKLGDIFVIDGANDFPHSDSTWPWSRELLKEHTKGLTPMERDLILYDNVCELYGLTTETPS